MSIPDYKHRLPALLGAPDPAARRVLSETELSDRWGISAKTLQRWRSEGRGPQYMKLSKRVGYPLEAIQAFEKHVLHDATSLRAPR